MSRFWKSQQGKLLIAKRYKAAFLIAFVVILGYPASALPIKNVQSTTSCDLIDCVTWVDLTTLGLNTNQINNVKGMNLTKFLPRAEQYTGLIDMGYNITGNVLYITGHIKDNVYWTMDLGTYVTLDPWWNTTFPCRRNMTVYNNKTDYATFVNVSYSTGMQADFDDVRFVDGTSILPYFIRRMSASGYAEYDVINVSNTTSMYFCNPDVSSISNVTAVWGNNLLAYHTNDALTGTVLIDIVNVNGYNNGTINGADWTTSGRKGNALQYIRANSDYVNFSSTANLLGNNFTIELWLNMLSVPANGQSYSTVSKCTVNDATQCTYSNHIENNNTGSRVYFDIKSGSTWAGALRSQNTLAKDQWYLVDYVYNTTHRLIYVNGTLDNVGAYSSTPNTGGAMEFGRFYIQPTSYHFFNGTMDEQKMWNRSLTATEIANHFATVEPAVTFVAGPIENYTEATLTTLKMNGTQANLSVTNNTYVSLEGLVNVTGLNVTLVRNGTYINDSLTNVTYNNTFFNGLWNITAFYGGNNSFNSSYETWWLTVTNITPPLVIYNVSIDTHICFKTKPVCIDTLTNKVYINGVQQ